MTNQNDFVRSTSPVSDPVPDRQRTSLDWWAVIFALALTGLVLLGLPVQW